jgi:copper transport protein
MSLLGIIRTLLFLILIGSNAPSAIAHAALVSSEPADGVLINEPPQKIIMKFTEPVSPVVLRLTKPEGGTVNLTGAQLVDDALVIPAPKGLREGTYVLSWRIISQDGHPVGGTVVFAIGKESEANISAQSRQAPGLKPVIWLLRVGLYLTLFFGVGVTVFLNWTMEGKRLPRSFARSLAFGLVLVFPIAIISLGVLGIDALGAPWRDLLGSAVWQAALSTSYSLTAGAACLAALSALISISVKERAWAHLSSFAALALAGVAIAASGHAATAVPQAFSRPAVFTHVACATLWAGALLSLAYLYWTSHPTRTAVLRRSSSLMVWSVAILVLSGVAIAVLQLKPFSSLFTTSYGQVLLAKLCLVICLLALACYNRYWLTAPTLAGEIWAERRLLHSVGVELFLVLAILGIVALWRFTPPPRSMAMPSSEIALHVHSQQLMAELHIVPGKVGANSMTIEIIGAPAKAVNVSIRNDSAKIEPIRREAMRTNHQTWTVPELQIPVSGHWMLRLDVLVSDFESVTLESSFNTP